MNSYLHKWAITWNCRVAYQHAHISCQHSLHVHDLDTTPVNLFFVVEVKTSTNAGARACHKGYCPFLSYIFFTCFFASACQYLFTTLKCYESTCLCGRAFLHVRMHYVPDAHVHHYFSHKLSWMHDVGTPDAHVYVQFDLHDSI